MLEIERWLDAWRGIGVDDSHKLRMLYSEVLTAYSDSHRSYHTIQHLTECMEKVEEIISLAKFPDEVRLGLWFHDAVYDTHRNDNEERSAAWVRRYALELHANEGSAQRIYDLILFTRHAAEPVGIDAQVLVDADLSILGASLERFQEYENQVRKEYEWVPEPTFRSVRAGILEEFLARPHLFCTDSFRTRYEAQARENLAHSIKNLR